MSQRRVKPILSAVLLAVFLALYAGSAAADQPVERPNILVVLLDDYGTGQFAPLSRHLGLDQVDPRLLAYTAALKEPYDPRAALEASQQAMPFMDQLSEQGMLFSRAIRRPRAPYSNRY